MKRNANQRINPIAQWVRARQLDVAIDRAQTATPYPQAPVIQSLYAFTEEAQPDAAFVEALAARLQTRYAVAPTRSAKTRRGNPLLMRLSWGMTIVCTVLITLALVWVLRPTMAPAERILADAAAATARRPGMVEHIVVENYLEITLTSEAPTREFYIGEEWRQLEAGRGDAVATTARSTIRYAIADVQRQMPVSWAYVTADKTCVLTRDRYGIITGPPDSDAAGCVPGGQPARLFVPELASPNLETDLHLWIGRLQGEVAALAYEQTTFFGKPALSFTEQQGTATFTLYIDPDTTYPLGFVARTPVYTLTQIVHIYELIAAESLMEAPFAWPPPTGGEGFEVTP